MGIYKEIRLRCKNKRFELISMQILDAFLSFCKKLNVYHKIMIT